VNANVYSVMFGGRSLAGFQLSEEDRQYGRFNLVRVVECAGRCIEAGRFRAEDDMLVAHHMWLAMHGAVTLEIGDYLIEPCDAERCFESQLVTLMVGAGDTLDKATESVRRSASTFGDVFGDESAEGLDGGGGRRERTPSESR
jgi:hypothetical protein